MVSTTVAATYDGIRGQIEKRRAEERQGEVSKQYHNSFFPRKQTHKVPFSAKRSRNSFITHFSLAIKPHKVPCSAKRARNRLILRSQRRILTSQLDSNCVDDSSAAGFSSMDFGDHSGAKKIVGKPNRKDSKQSHSSIMEDDRHFKTRQQQRRRILRLYGFRRFLVRSKFALPGAKKIAGKPNRKDSKQSHSAIMKDDKFALPGAKKIGGKPNRKDSKQSHSAIMEDDKFALPGAKKIVGKPNRKDSKQSHSSIMEDDRHFKTRQQQRRRILRLYGFRRFLVRSKFALPGAKKIAGKPNRKDSKQSHSAIMKDDKFALPGAKKIGGKPNRKDSKQSHSAIMEDDKFALPGAKKIGGKPNRKDSKQSHSAIMEDDRHFKTRQQQRRRILRLYGFRRFLVRSKFALPGAKKIRGKHTVGKRKKTEMDDDFVIKNLPHPFKLPHKVAEKFCPHHHEGLEWLLSLHHEGRGGIIADDVELQVTAVLVCIFIVGLFHSNLAQRVLIVTGQDLNELWEKNFSDFGLLSELKVDTLHREGFHMGRQDGKFVYLESRMGMTKFTHKDAGNDEALDYMFVDEADLLRNPNTILSKSLSLLCCKHRILITKTPVQNKLAELWALFRFCVPGILGCETEFFKKYDCFRKAVEGNTPINEEDLGYSAAQSLRKSIRPFFLRRAMSDFGILLPKKDEMVIWLKLTPIQRQRYKSFLNNKETLTKNNLAPLSVLRQICDHPRLEKGVADDPVANLELDVSCKIRFISSLLNDLLPKGHFILIFSQSAQMLGLIEDLLKMRGDVYARLDGKTKIQDREKLVKDFQEGNGPNILLLTSGVGGCELTLTKADRVILVNPAWNPCADNQCVDRAYRIGQTKDVIVYRLITCGTIEEKTYIKQVLKEGLIRRITENEKQPRYFNTEDSKDIYSLPTDEAFDSSQAALRLPKPQDHQHTMEASLQQHVEFLNSLDIAGVTYHTRLFSDTFPVQEDVVEG
ncbi:protein CHROMATIN REMODELING 24-like [Henckelia pumila]|uniref:protein CHROMATIN REMODELING 24-like n=1 Tax=Henckelia pumila TaxID=405737 RepID=UPI003C6E36CB